MIKTNDQLINERGPCGRTLGWTLIHESDEKESKKVEKG
jgi:hypothetical protein